MEKHTKGPWSYFVWDQRKPKLFTIGSDYVEGGPDHIITNAEISEADARLIAAAPEMLQTLKSVLGLLYSTQAWHDQSAPVVKAHDLIRDAIAHAEGKA